MKYIPKHNAKDPLTDPGFRAALLSHYDAHARDLPWRGESDPYRVLVSEVMLQQTRVETVKGYYDRWLERFPDVGSLADASEDDVLKAWEGLGYYRRARNLHRAAAVVRERGGSLPRDQAELRALPGVGEYTAGAVASIAFGEAVPAVDGNVRRVLARLMGEAAPTAGWLRERAALLLEPTRPGDWNQAVMEHGATVCTPQAPSCGECPVDDWCAANATGTQAELPIATRRAPPRSERISLAVLEWNDRVLLRRRPPDGLLGGLWAFPEEDPVALALKCGLVPGGDGIPLPDVVHRFTHLEATYQPIWLECEASIQGGPVEVGGATATRADQVDTECQWVDADAVDVALPVAQRKVLDLWRTAKEGA
jgi:A/G-specific adenine glycosylase